MNPDVDNSAKSLPEPGTAEFNNLLTDLYNACNPNEAATEQQYVDLSEARGSDALTQEVIRRLRFTSPESGRLRFLVCGHIGGGKSSELRHLVDHLSDSSKLVNGRRFFPVYLNTDDYLNAYDADLPELLLAIAAQIGEALEKSRLKIKIEDNYFLDLIKRMGEGFLTQLGVKQFEVGGTLPKNLATLKLVIEPLKRDESARKQVRQALTTHVESLHTEINRVLESARLKLKQYEYPSGEPAYDDIVLIVDNLEKVSRFGGETDSEKSAYNLFVLNAPTLTSLRTHLIYTLPLRAVYAYPGDLQSRYGKPPHSIPMVAVGRRSNPDIPYEKGRDCLKAMLQRRMSGFSLEALFELDALNWLLDMSGGHVRSLMIFVQSAIAESDDVLPINLAVAKRATGPTLQLFSRSVPDSYWPLMAALHRSATREIDESKPEFRTMLEQLMVLEYRNGDEGTDAESEPWYAVNPIIRRLNGFKAALDKFDADAANS